jgi:hypothetical protein
MRVCWKAWVVVLAVVVLFVSTIERSVCDDAHETACTPDCSCVCGSVEELHAERATTSVENLPLVRHGTGAAPLRPDLLLVADIFRPPLRA